MKTISIAYKVSRAYGGLRLPSEVVDRIVQKLNTFGDFFDGLEDGIEKLPGWDRFSHFHITILIQYEVLVRIALLGAIGGSITAVRQLQTHTNGFSVRVGTFFVLVHEQIVHERGVRART